MVGTTISHYKVLEKIGQGGMGEVYRAEDTNLSRDVAIKVLPEQFTQDPQRLARFEREAKLLASLNHPNIAAIHSFEHANDTHFLVLELVEGETLAERVAKGPLPVEEVLEVCRQIAEGVEAAHEKGVIHRDLKPTNVKVTPEGKVKILDFGLAKAFEAETPVTDISQSPTLTEEMTRAGVILGTAAYMSPEQAKGKPVDKRTDIFGFGCVLYELLTGKRAFEGETITETLGAIIHKEPDWERLPATTPWRIQELLRRCLTKDAHDRLRGIANVRVEIRLALEEPTSARGRVRSVQPPPWKRAIPWGIAGVVGIAGFALWSLTPPAPKSLRKFMITPPLDAPLGNFDSNDLTISPDGTEVVYLAQNGDKTQLYVRRLDDFASTPIPGTEGVREGGVLFSPDGESVVFFSGGTVKRVSLRGGEPTTLSQASMWRGGSWVGDTIVFSGQEELSDRGQTVLMWAVAQEHPEVVGALVEHGADLQARSATLPLYTPKIINKSSGAVIEFYSKNVYFPKVKGGFTPLMFAGQAGALDSARILLAAGADVNAATPDDGSALVLASSNGLEKVALFLLEKGADPNATDGYGLTALHWALQEGIVALFSRPYITDRFWVHPNMPELVRALLAHGADPNARITSDFLPYDIQRFSRTRGNSLPQVGLTGGTPFLLASAAADLGAMRVLVEAGADPKVATEEGTTPLMVAAGMGPERGSSITEEQQKNFLEAVKLTLQWGNDVNAVTLGERTALHGAALYGLTEVVQFLAEKDADLDAQDMYGQTALSIAMADPDGLVYRHLKDYNPDDRFRRRRGGPHEETVELLLKLGATPYTRNGRNIKVF